MKCLKIILLSFLSYHWINLRSYSSHLSNAPVFKLGYFSIFGYVYTDYENSKPYTMTSGERLIWWCQKQNKSRIKTIIKRSSFGRSRSNRKQPLKLCSTAVWLIEWNKFCYGYGLYIHYWLMKSSALSV